MGKNKCVIGDLFRSDPTFPTADLGVKLSNALELPWRNNIKDISAIPEGEYRGSIRTDGDRGWRIELKGTGARENIQVHIGNKPDNTVGCILPGTGDSTDASCFVSGSAEAMKRLREAYGNDNKRPVFLRVQS